MTSDARLGRLDRDRAIRAERLQVLRGEIDELFEQLAAAIELIPDSYVEQVAGMRVDDLSWEEGVLSSLFASECRMPLARLGADEQSAASVAGQALHEDPAGVDTITRAAVEAWRGASLLLRFASSVCRAVSRIPASGCPS